MLPIMRSSSSPSLSLQRGTVPRSRADIPLLWSSMPLGLYTCSGVHMCYWTGVASSISMLYITACEETSPLHSQQIPAAASMCVGCD